MAYLDYNGVLALIPKPRGTIQWLVSTKRIPHLRIGPRSVLFDEDQLRAWLASLCVVPIATSTGAAEACPTEVSLRGKAKPSPNPSQPKQCGTRPHRRSNQMRSKEGKR